MPAFSKEDAETTLTEARAFGPNEERFYNAPEAIRDSVVSAETRLYAVSPPMSMPAPGWVEANAEFWKRP